MPSNCNGKGRSILLVLAKVVATKFLVTLGNVNPEAAMTTDGRGTLDSEPDSDGMVILRGQIDVLAMDLRRSVIVQRQQVDFVGRHGLRRAHDAKEKSESFVPRATTFSRISVSRAAPSFLVLVEHCFRLGGERRVNRWGEWMDMDVKPGERDAADRDQECEIRTVSLLILPVQSLRRKKEC
jgi:hypothetical protein